MGEFYACNAVFLILGLTLILIDSWNKLKKSEHRFISVILIGITIMYVALDCACVLLMITENYNQAIFSLCNTFFYLCYVTLPFLWFVFSHHFASAASRKYMLKGNKKLLAICLIPYAINIILIILTSLGAGYLWHIGDASARYSRGPLFPLLGNLNMIYYFMPVIEILILLTDIQIHDKQTLVRALGFAAIPAVGVFIYTSFIPADIVIPFQPYCFFIGIMFAYILLLSEVYDSMEKIADTDALTGVKSKYSFLMKEMEMDRQIRENTVKDFAIVVFDINGLKFINDTKGHEAGDTYIKEGTRFIEDLFQHSLIYRIGGDEFTAVLCDRDFTYRETLMRTYHIKIDNNIKGGQVVMAAGMATYHKEKDATFQDVFDRADARMYENKIELTKMGVVSR